MDWKLVDKKFPKSYELMRKYYCKDESVIDIVESNVRLLPDFFNANDIFIEISFNCFTRNKIEFEGIIWVYDFTHEVNRTSDYMTRPEAEEEDFMLAFEELEKKLQ